MGKVAERRASAAASPQRLPQTLDKGVHDPARRLRAAGEPYG